MTVFNGSSANDTANAATGVLNGFFGSVNQLTDNLDDVFNGHAGNDFIFAGNANDFIEGGYGQDRLNGGGGDDTIFGFHANFPDGDGGRDEIVGNDGNDTLIGSGGADGMDGGDDDDVMGGGSGDDIMWGNLGDDNLSGGDGNDTLYADLFNRRDDLSPNTLHGEGGNDVLIGAAGNDRLIGGLGADTMEGADGDDTFIFQDGPDEVGVGEIIDGGAGHDVIELVASTSFVQAASIANIEEVEFVNSAVATFTAQQVKTGMATNLLIRGDFGVDITFVVHMLAETSVNISGFTFSVWSIPGDSIRIEGDDDAETMVGWSLNDLLFGNGGNDILNGAGGADTMTGGAGDDSYLVDNADDVIVETTGTDNVNASVSYTLAAGVAVETLRTTNAAATTPITLIGNNLANIVTGNAGHNILSGGGGVDKLQGLGGNDSYAVDNAADVIVDSAGVDSVSASVSYTLAAGVAVETLRTTNAAGTAAINLTGNNLANIVTGNAGANNLNGGAGIDTMQGLAGNDIYVVDNVADKAIEAVSAGTDRVDSAVSFTLGTNVENLTLTGVAAISGAGNTLANIIIGNSANNGLNGGAGVDSMRGGLGNDSYIVDHVSDQVVESASAGTDRIVSSVTEVLTLNVENLTLSGTAAINGTGNTLNNVIIGNAANNILAGSSGIDSLSGGTGNDVLIGGGHRDIMTGGAGLDDFDFNVVAEMGKTATTRDVITDFTLGDDIDLSTIDANGALAGHTFSFLATKGAAFTGAAGQLRWSQSGATTIVEGTVNADKVADFQIQLTGLKTLTAADFIL